MSGIHFTLEESLKLGIARYYGFEYEKIVLANPRVPEGAAALQGADRAIDVLCNGETHTVQYKRFNLTDVVGSYNFAANPWETDVPLTLQQISDNFKAIGINIPVEYIDSVKTVPVLGTFNVFIKEDCPYMTGSVTIAAGVYVPPPKYPKPLHEFMLMGDLKNTGSAAKDMTAPFKFVRLDSGTWGTLTGGKTPQVFGSGIEFPTVSNWTLDFEIVVKSVSQYNSIFAETIPGGYVPGTICFYNGLLYESHLTHGVHGKAIVPNTPTRHTLVCKNNVVEYYFNGVKVETWSTQASRKAFRGFRNTGSGDELFAEDISYIRKLRFWDTTVSGTDLDNLFNDTGPALPKYPAPEHEWLLNGNYKNTGKSTLAITDKFKFVDLPSGKWATLTGGRTPIEIGPGVSMVRTGDWCLDFEMIAKQRLTRNTIFNNGISDANANTVMFYANALYIPFGNSSSIHTFEMPINTVTRHTLRCVSGTIYYYMDGLLAQSWTNGGTLPWNYFRSTFGDTEQMEEDKTYLRKIRFWQGGMTDVEFQALLDDDGIIDVPPVHRWLLDNSLLDTGSSEDKVNWKPPVAFSVQADGSTMANLTSIGNHPLGLSHNASGDWTIAARVIDPTPGLKGFFTTAGMVSYGVSTIIYQNKLTLYMGTSYSNLWTATDPNILMMPNKKHSLVLTKRGNAYRAYIDGKLVQRVSAIANVADAFTHFGAYNGTASLDTTVKFSDLRIYDYGIGVRQAREFANGDKVTVPYAQPDHEWIMDGTPRNTGKLATAFAAAVKYKFIGDKQYATFTKAGFNRFGVNLANTANWTIDFTVLYTALAEYEHLLGGESSGSQTGVIKMFNGKVYEVSCTQNGVPSPIAANKPVRMTFICNAGVVTYYQDGVQASTWTTTALASRAAITGFGSLYGSESIVPPDKMYFRAFRYYARAITAVERDALFKQ